MASLCFSESASIQKSKLLKVNSEPDSEFFPKDKKNGAKIKSIPLIYKRMGYDGDPKRIHKISVKGYKYISRVNASGEYTVEFLNKIQKLSPLKMARRVDFDPYLCETSGLKSLYHVLKKFKGLLKSLNLTFRRFTIKDELKRFCPCLARLNKVKKINVEFPNPQGIDLQDLDDLARYSKRLSLKSARVSFSGPKDVVRNLYKLEGIIASSHKLEEMRSEAYFSHINSSQFEKIKRKEPRKGFFKDLKYFSAKFAYKTGWSSLFDGEEIGKGFQQYIRQMPSTMNPTHFCIIFDKLQTPLGTLQELVKMLPLLTNLRFLFIELNLIKLTQFEMMVLAKGFVDCKQIEHLTFKHLDNMNISMIDLMQFIVIIAKYSGFPKFDFFFRKIFVPEWQTQEAKRQLDDIENIKYVLSKQSLHIQKIPPP